MSTSKSSPKLAEKPDKVSSVKKGTKNNNPSHPSHEVNLTWTQWAKLAQKGSLVTKVGNPKLPKVRNKNAVIFHLDLVKHLPFSKICSSLYDQHKQSILGIYRLTDLDYLEIVFLDAATYDQYLKKGLQICGFKLSGYDNSQFRNFLTINLNSIPIMEIESLKNALLQQCITLYQKVQDYTLFVHW